MTLLKGSFLKCHGLLVLHCNLADCAGDLSQRPQQLDYLQRALTLQTQPLHHPEQLLPPYTSLVLLLVAQRRTAEAGHHLEQARLLMTRPEAERYRALYERARGSYFLKPTATSRRRPASGGPWPKCSGRAMPKTRPACCWNWAAPSAG